MKNGSHFQALPLEVMDLILSMATRANQEEGVRYTYGLSREQTLSSCTISKVDKYVRGPIPEASARWDASRSIRQVCSSWGAWATRHNFSRLREHCLPQAERWADLPVCRAKYSLYEMIDRPRGACISRNPQRGLERTSELLAKFPRVATSVRRLSFDGYIAAETNSLILSIIDSCQDLIALTIPHVVLARCTTEQWIGLLGLASRATEPLRALEINIICSTYRPGSLEYDDVQIPSDERVTFKHITHLKICEISSHRSQSILQDHHLLRISKTATDVQSLQFTGSSSTSAMAAIALAQASQKTLETFRHRPYSKPVGSMYREKTGHGCEQIATLSRLRDLDVSLPNICRALFAKSRARWAGLCFIRFEGFCSPSHECANSGLAGALKEILAAARGLIAERSRCRVELRIELSWNVYVFDVWTGTVSREGFIDAADTREKRFQRVDDRFRAAAVGSVHEGKPSSIRIAEDEFLQAVQNEDR